MDIALEEIGHVSGEGGPLLLVDRMTAISWRGVEAGGKDYERACAVLEVRLEIEGGAIEIDHGVGLVWDMEGGGTAGVFRRARNYVVVARIWPKDPDDSEAFLTLAAAHSVDLCKIAELPIISGTLAILWAPEDGRAFESIDPFGLPMGEMSMGGTGLTLELASGIYDCFHDSVVNAAGEVRRCHLIRRTALDR
jgi:hypothetical protein